MKNVSRETLESKKKLFFDLLKKWNRTHNLVQKDSIDDFSSRHWEDSLQVASFIPNKNTVILDIGSGAGFPGIPLACAGHNVTLCEIIEKKIAFLKVARHSLDLNLQLIEGDAYKIQEKYDFITSRAFSELENLLKIMKNVSRETSIGLFLKGKTYFQEVAAAQKKYNFSLKIHPSQTSKDGVILEISNLQKK